MIKNLQSYLIQVKYWLLFFPKLTIFLKGEKYYKEGDVTHFFDQQKLSSNMRFILHTKRLNYIARAGYLLPGRDIPFFLCESDAEHIFGMLILLRVVRSGFRDQFPGVDWEDALIMTIGHENGEVINEKGDITPSENISKEEKYNLEHASVVTVFGDSRNLKYDYNLWQRYVAQKDPTAILVKQIDYLQMIIEVKVLEKRFNKDLSEFYTEEKINTKLSSPVLRNLFYELT